MRNTNDLVAGIRRIAAESRHYYLLGYVPGNTRRDGKFRRIEVKLRRPGLTVRARRGYFAPGDRSAAPERTGLDPDVPRALDAPSELPGVPLRATALVFEERTAGVATVLIAAEADVRRFAFEPRSGRLTDVLEFAVAASNLETGAVSRFGQSVEMSLLPETLRRLEVEWYPMAREFLAPAPTTPVSWCATGTAAAWAA